jgi:uncharacterized protein involved in outer membrane biogenesis
MNPSQSEHNKMKAIKVIGALALGLIAILAIVSYLFLSNLDSIVKGVIEDVGTEVTGTAVTLSGVNINLTTGDGTLSGLTIANPEGYQSDYALRLDTIAVGVSPMSLTGPVIVITQIKIDGAKLIAEQRGQTTNLSDLLKNMAQPGDHSEEEPEPQSSEPSTNDVRLMMEKFDFINTEATVISEYTEQKTIKISDIRRTNIGNKDTGLTPEELAQKLLGSVVSQVQDAVGKYLGKIAADAAEAKLTEKLGEKLGEGGMSAVKGLKSFFKRDSDEDK